MVLNKKGDSGILKPLLVVLGIIVAFWIFISILPMLSSNGEVLKGSAPISSVWGEGFGLFDYIFGTYSTYLAYGDGDVAGVGEKSAIIITIAIWFLIFLTFGDIIKTFSTFSAGISWWIGFILAIIAANLKGPILYLSTFLGIFSFLGSLAVVIGLFAAFIAFIGVNWGISSWGPWLMRRRMMQVAYTTELADEAGARNAASGLKVLAEVEKAARTAGAEDVKKGTGKSSGKIKLR